MLSDCNCPSLLFPNSAGREKKIEAERVQEPTIGVFASGQVEKVVVVLVLAVDESTVQ